jgi:hypothetical protein
MTIVLLNIALRAPNVSYVAAGGLMRFKELKSNFVTITTV